MAEEQTDYERGYDDGLAQGHFDFLIKAACGSPEFTMNKEINEVLEMPFEDLSKWMKEFAEKEGQTFREVVIFKEVGKFFKRLADS